MAKKKQSYLEWIWRLCFFMILFSMGSSSLQCQNDQIIFDHLTSAQGLSQASVTCIAQDKKGFMWFGTDEGLNRFDGYNFKVFLPDPGNKESLRDMRITALFIDHHGILWVGTRNFGLHRYDHEQESFFNYHHDNKNINSLSHNAIIAIREDRNGLLLIGTEGGGLNIFDQERNRFTRYRHDTRDSGSISGNVVYAIFQDQAGHIWIGTDKGLNRYDNGRFTRFLNKPGNTNSLPRDSVYAINESQPGILWLGTDGGGLCKFDTIQQRFITFRNQPKNPNSLSHDRIRAIYTDVTGKLWIGTWGGGLDILDPRSEKFSVYMNQPGNPNSINDNSIFAIFEDRAGVMWIATMNSGINKFPRERKKFKHYTHNPTDPNSLNDSIVFGITETQDGIVWIGTFSGGLNRFDRKTGIFTSFKHDPANPNSLPDNRIPNICPGQDGLLWIGTTGGLSCFDPKKNNFTNYLHDPDNSNSLNHNRTFTVFRDRQSYIWIGTRGGLDRFDPQNKIFTHYRHNPEDPESLSQDSVYLIYEDRENMLWVGTEDGLNRFDRQTGKFTVYRHDFNNPNSISNNGIYSICETRSGEFWIGSTGGLNRMDRATGTFSHFLVSDGLPNNVIYGILEDSKGNLWLSTNNGLSRFDPKNRRFRNFTSVDGLQGTEFNGFSYFKNSSGDMCFGGINGFNIFSPEEITDNAIIPPVVLTDFKILNKSVPFGVKDAGENAILKKPISETADLVLSYRIRSISFEFAALDFTYPGKNLYACKMEGIDSDWNYTDSRRRFRDYSSLPPGQYVFRVKGSNSDQVWNEVGLALKLRITPPFWQTWWFRTLFVLFILFLIIFIYRLRVRQLKRREKELEQQVNERTQQLFAANKELEKLSLVASETDNAVIIMDINGDIEWLNDGFTRMYKYSLEQVVAEKGRNIKNLSNNPHIGEYFADCLQQKKSIMYETACLNRDGRNFWSQTTLTPILDDAGKVKKVIAIDTEITKIKEAEEAADRANQSKSEFLARMSHEIRTPMNGVIGFSDMLLDTDLNEEQVDYARTISRSGEALITLLNDILDFSKIEAGELVLDPIDFDPELTAFDICDLILPRIATKPVEIFCRIGDNVPAFIKADPGRFRQVIINLMGNAIKFTDNGSIELSLEVAKEENDRLQLLTKIKDTGIGIPEDKLEKVFEVFQQADGSTTRKYGGTGLGLSICRQIAHLMEGNVWVESQLGKGSTFYFSSWVGKSGKEAEKHSTALAGKRVLVVDDNPTNLEILSHVLLRHKMEVIELTDPRRVIQLIKKYQQNDKPIDICIMDIQMPEFSGYDLAKSIRQLEAPFKNLPLLAFSSSTLSRSKRFREAGFNGFLPKPIRRVKLIKMIEWLLGMAEEENVDTQKEEIVTQHTLTEEGKHSVHILLVEDNAINLKLALFMLEKAGYKLTIAENGQQAIDIFTANPDSYDLIFMDVQMPVMDGKTASRKLRQMGYKDIAIVAMTADAMKGDREKCLEAGMNDYIAKPIKRDEVFKIVKKWCLDREKQLS